MKKMQWVLLHFGIILCLLLLGSNKLNAFSQKARSYKIIAAESNLWVYVAKAGFLSALAHNHNIGVASFSGTVSVPESGATGSSMQLELDAKSLNVADKGISEKDRSEITKSMHGEVLHSDQYAKIVFKSVSISEVKPLGGDNYSFTVQGDLMLHGITKRIGVPVTATITAQQLKATGKYTLKQSLFGIKPYAKAGGAIKVKDEVIVNFSIVARAQ